MDYHGPETSDPRELVKSKLRVEMGDRRKNEKLKMTSNSGRRP